MTEALISREVADGPVEKGVSPARRGAAFAYRALLALVIAAGAVGIVRTWYTGLGLWNDEAAIAINLREKSWYGLTAGLEYLQVAPVGWLWLEKAVLTLLGPANTNLRLVSTAGSLALLILGPFAAHRAAGRFAALVTAALLAVSPLLIKFAGELKQYSVEAAIAVALLLLGSWMYGRLTPGRGPEAGDASGRRAGATGQAGATGWAGATGQAGGVTRTGGIKHAGAVMQAGVLKQAVRFGVVRHAEVIRPAGTLGLAISWIGLTMIAVLLSLTAVLVLFGVVVGIMLALGLARRWRDAIWLGAISLPAGLFAGALVVRRAQYGFMSGQTDYFRDGVAPKGSGIAGIVEWLPRMWNSFVSLTLVWTLAPVVLALMMIGLIGLWRRGQQVWAGMLACALLAGVGAAALRAVPVTDRVALYLIGPVVIMVAAGLDSLMRLAWQLGRSRRFAAAALAAVLAVAALIGQGFAAQPGAIQAHRLLLNPLARDSIAAALNEVADRLEPGDVVLVYWFSDKVYRWYAPTVNLPVVGYARLFEAGSPECAAGAPIDEALRGAKRVFYVQSRMHSSDASNFFDVIVPALSLRGHVVEAHPAVGDPRRGRSAWALVDLSAGPDPVPPVAPNRGERTCLGVDPKFLTRL